MQPTFPALFLPPLIFGALMAFLTTPLTIRLARFLNLVDNPATHKHPKVIHTYPVPRGGGIPIFIAILTGIFLFQKPDIRLLGLLAGAAFSLLIGLADDRWDLNPYLRVVANLASGLFLVAAGITLSYTNNPFGGVINFTPWQALAVTLLWVGGMMNFLGMGAGGVDGQHAGVVTIAASTLALLSARYLGDPAQWPVIILAGLTAGAYLGFLPWNFYPQKIIPGYSGKSLAGYLLAALAIMSVSKLQTALMVMAVPLADVAWAMARRILSGKSPVWGDNSHLHHKLLALGWSKPKIAVFYWGVTAVSGVLALWLNSRQKFYTLTTVFIAIGAFIVWISFYLSAKVSGRSNGSKI